MAIQYCDYDIKGTLAVAGNATFAGTVTATGGNISSSVSGGDSFLISTSASTTGRGFVKSIGDTGAVLFSAIYGSASTGTLFGTSLTRAAAMITTSDTSVHPTSLLVGTFTGIPLIFGTNNTEALKLDASQNATFAGSTTIETGINLESGVLVIKNATTDSSGLRLFQDSSDASKIYNNYNGTLQLGVNNTTSLTLGSSQTATFTGDLYIPEYLYHAGDTNTYLRFQSDSIELQTGGWKVFGNTTLKYGALYGDNSLRVYATQAGGYINGTLTVDTISNATSDTDKFLVSDGDEIKYRTGAEVLADIGAGTGTITGSGNNKEIAFFDTGSNITSSSSLTRPSAGVLYSEIQYQVKPGATNAGYSCTSDTDTGLGDFDGANGVSLISKGAKQITVKENTIKFDPYTATAVGTGSPAGALNANQNNQAPTQDTLAQLCVDPSGNVVRGEQEGTWTFTRAQLNATLGNTLISAPGTNKGIIVTESDWMIKFSSTGAAVSGNQSYDVRQANYANASANISTLPGARINEIIGISGTVPNPSYGWVSRDIPLTTRTYKTNVATTLNKKTGDQLPTNVVSISIKLKYRIFDATTF